MGKITGFIEYKREISAERSPIERINDWNEFKTELPEEKQKIQGGRCMDCSLPYCHTGILINNMASGCPVYNLIPEWNDLIYKGLWKEAIERLHQTNNFPEFTGRVCPAPCEGSCTVAINDPAVTIKTNECVIIDRAFKKKWVKPILPKIRTGKKVAVVGSGPAGLSCAQQLNWVGHDVTVYERADRVGGILMYGIPNMKLDKLIVERRVNIMEKEGIRFIVNTEIGIDVKSDRLKKEFDAIVLCCGATKPRDLLIEGRDAKGIYFAMEFLHSNTKSLLDSGLKDDCYISARDKDVIIIGGGDTGTNCVATALRHKCKSVVQFEIMPMLHIERAHDNPWPQWPNVYKLDYGHEEAKAKFGEDPRKYLIMTKKFIKDYDGNVKEIHTVNIEWENKNGKFTPVEIPNSEKIWPCQLVLLSMGFLGPEDKLIEDLNLERDERTNVKAKYGNFKTNVKGIFSAGDMRRGQSLVVWAINEGRSAARECDRYLMGYTRLP